MNSEIERFRELGRLVRTAQAELTARQFELMDAHERELNPIDLGLRIAHLGRQIAAWKREREILFRRIAGDDGGGFYTVCGLFARSRSLE